MCLRLVSKKPTEMPKVSALFCVTQIDDLLLEFRSVKRQSSFCCRPERTKKSCPTHQCPDIFVAEEMLFVAVSLLRMLRYLQPPERNNNLFVAGDEV